MDWKDYLSIAAYVVFAASLVLNLVARRTKTDTDNKIVRYVDMALAGFKWLAAKLSLNVALPPALPPAPEDKE